MLGWRPFDPKQRKSKFYRTGEPVPIEPLETDGGRGRSGMAILLGAGYASQDLTIAGDGWAEVGAKAVSFSRGANRVKLSVMEGKVRIDWLAFH